MFCFWLPRRRGTQAVTSKALATDAQRGVVSCISRKSAWRCSNFTTPPAPGASKVPSMHSYRHEHDFRHDLGRRDSDRDNLSARRDREEFSDRRNDFRARHDGGRFAERRDGAGWSDRHDRGEPSYRRDRSPSPDRAAVYAARSAADRAMHRHGLPPFSRHHKGVADADDAVRFASSFLSHGTWWSLANLTKQLYEHMPCLLYTSPSPRDRQKSRMPSSA